MTNRTSLMIISESQCVKYTQAIQLFEPSEDGIVTYKIFNPSIEKLIRKNTIAFEPGKPKEPIKLINLKLRHKNNHLYLDAKVAY